MRGLLNIHLLRQDKRLLRRIVIDFALLITAAVFIIELVVVPATRPDPTRVSSFITVHNERSQSHAHGLARRVPDRLLPLYWNPQRAQLHHRRDAPLRALQKLDHLLVLLTDFSQHFPEFTQKFVLELEQLTGLVEEFKAVFEWIIQFVKLTFSRERIQKVE